MLFDYVYLQNLLRWQNEIYYILEQNILIHMDMMRSKKVYFKLNFTG